VDRRREALRERFRLECLPVRFEDVQVVRANSEDEIERNNVYYRKALVK
jgi:hypothetical protein